MEDHILENNSFDAETERPFSEITYLRLAFHGSEYSNDLDGKVRELFKNFGTKVVIRGQKGPAAGSCLATEIIVALGSGLLTEGVIKLLGVLYSKVKEIKGDGAGDGHWRCRIDKTTVEDQTCDYIISTTSAAGVNFDNLNYSELIGEMHQLVEEEKADGRSILRIEAPCSIDYIDGHIDVKASGFGNFSLWLVTYREGERWPFCLYDSVNRSFIPMESRDTVLDATRVEDKFYKSDCEYGGDDFCNKR